MNRTHIALVVDRSGSMGVVQAQMNQAVDSTLDELGTLSDCIVDVWTFDSTVEHTAVGASPCAVPRGLIVPRGMTALHDAIGTAITTLMNRGIAHADTVRVIIVTDGMENCSVEHTATSTAELIAQARRQGWNVAFIGTTQAQAGSQNLGTMDRTAYQHTSAGVSAMSAQMRSYATTSSFTRDEPSQAPAVDVHDYGLDVVDIGAIPLPRMQIVRDKIAAERQTWLTKIGSASGEQTTYTSAGPGSHATHRPYNLDEPSIRAIQDNG